MTDDDGHGVEPGPGPDPDPGPDGPAAWLAARSRATLALLGGAALALVGLRLVRLGGTDPGSLLAYVGAGGVVVGQTLAVAGLAVWAWRLLRA